MPSRALDIPGPDGAIDATLHTPADASSGQGAWPGVVMLTDILGPRPAVYTMADRLAGLGYAVLVPNVYYREGRAPVPAPGSSPGDPKTQKALFALKATLTPERMRADARAHLDGLATLPEVRDGPAGVVGYCMSGPYAVYTAEVGGSRVAAAASYHGAELIRDDAESPHQVATALDAAFYFGHAENDGLIPDKRLPEFDRALSEAGCDFVSEVYAGAQHGFAVPGTPRHDEPSAERHWRTLAQLFARTLG